MRFGKSTFGLTFPLGPGGHARLVSLALTIMYTRTRRWLRLATTSDWHLGRSTGSPATAYITVWPAGSGSARSSSRVTPDTCTPQSAGRDEHWPARRPQPRATSHRHRPRAPRSNCPGPLRTRAATGRARARQGHRPHVRDHRSARHHSRTAAPSHQRQRGKTRAPPARHTIRNTPGRLHRPVPNPLPLPRQRQPSAGLGR